MRKYFAASLGGREEGSLTGKGGVEGEKKKDPEG